MNRRILPLAAGALAIVVVACSNQSTDVQSVPYGFLSFAAQKATVGYTTNPIGTFYNATGLGVPTATAPWDSCRVLSYSRSPGSSLGSVFPSMNAGTAIQLKQGGRTDSLFPQAALHETQYRSRLTAGIPYVPGDSVAVVIPGAGGELGYPAVSFKAKTAEPFTVDDFGTPVAGTKINLKWTPGQDLNGTIVFSFRYSTPAVDTLNSQVYCQFRDDGTDTIPGKYVGSWAASAQRTWVASRIRTWVAPVSKGGYFDFISTFDLPTPGSPTR